MLVSDGVSIIGLVFLAAAGCSLPSQSLGQLPGKQSETDAVGSDENATDDQSEPADPDVPDPDVPDPDLPDPDVPDPDLPDPDRPIPDLPQIGELYEVTLHECPIYSTATGAGLGGGETIELCALTDSITGYMTIVARKLDDSSFGARPYQVRVSNVSDPPCGPDSHFYVISDDDPVGVGTPQLEFSFQSLWLEGQMEKGYCVTASTQPGDPGYDADSQEQQSWWWSQKAVLRRTLP